MIGLAAILLMTTPAQTPHVAGIANFHQVDNRLYRGAQPGDEGIRQLAQLGVRTIVNLRTGDEDAAIASELGLRHYHVPMVPWRSTDEQVVAWLRIVIEQRKHGPVFVHCRQGADRTGLMIAVYRVVVDGWSKQAAIQEMTQGDFNHHSIWRNLRKYVERMDVDSIRRQVGMPANESPISALADASNTSLHR